MAPSTLSCFLLIAILFLTGAESTTFTFTNNCQYTVWPGTLTGGGGAQLSSTGFELAPRATRSLTASAPWTGRVWGRTLCSTDSSGRFSCKTADCASGQVSCNGAGAIPPATLAEFTLQTNGNQDFYDVSNVDGFNLPISVTPVGGSGRCAPSSCPADVNSGCPNVLAIKGSNGATIACKSACVAFNQPQYCCTGSFNKPETCPPTNYSNYFSGKCPQAYSYAYDDKRGTFTCTGPSTYQITFCP